MTEQVRIDLEARDNASAKIEDVADAAADLEKLDPEVDVTADTSAADADLQSTTAAVRELDGRSAEVILKARVADAKGDLAALRAELDQTGEKAETTARQLDRIGGDPGEGIKTRGNAVADLTGPLGEASGAASDFAGVFDGLGDIAEDFVTKLGGSTAMASRVAGAIGGLGIVVAAGAAIWSTFSAAQKKATEEAEKNAASQRDLREALREANREAAATKFGELYGDAIALARELGVETEAAVGFITGETRTFGVEGLDLTIDQFGELNAKLHEARNTYADTTAEAIISEEQHRDIGLALIAEGEAADDAAEAVEKHADAARRAELRQHALTLELAETVGELDTLKGRLNLEQAILTFQTNFTTAMEKAKADTGLTAQEVLDLKDDYLTVAEALGTDPLVIQTELDKIAAGDVAGVLLDTQYELDTRPPLGIRTRLLPPITPGSLGGVGITPTLAPVPGGDTVNVYQTIPRGYRGDALRDARDAARRSGRLYRRAG